MSVSAAKSRVMQAKTQLESGRVGEVAGTLDAADKFIDGLPEAETAAVRAEIAAVRALLANTMKPEDTRALHAARGKIKQAQLAVAEENYFGLDETLAKAEEYLASIGQPPNAEIDAARADIAALRQRGQGIGKPAAAPKPGFMQMMRSAVAGPPSGQPQPQAATAAAAASPTLQAATVSLQPQPSAVSGTAQTVASASPSPSMSTSTSTSMSTPTVSLELPRVAVGGSWAEIQDDITGWELEAMGPNAAPLDEPPLPRTRGAILRIRHLLDDPQTRRIRNVAQGDPQQDAMYLTAERTLAGAAAQCSAAFHLALDAAERMPTIRRLELDRPMHIAHIADLALTGTTYHDAVVARARRLSERFEAETAAAMASRQAEYDAAVARATAAWPKIMARTDVQPELDATRLAARGHAVLLSGVLNRAGHDFGARDFPFSTMAGTTPLAGTYEPYVMNAFVHAWDEQKFDVSDRIPWDLIAVVDGPDTIRQRMVVVLDNQDTGAEIGRLEIWHPVECVRLRIIALRAGPVAVGP